MTSFEKSILVQHGASQMYSLVDDIESYPEFLPWCSNSKVFNRGLEHVDASLTIDFHGVRQEFITRNNISLRPHTMEINLIKGPFKSLHAKWQFQDLGEKACRVDFLIEYSFANIILRNLMGPVFKVITSSLVDAFVKRAKVLYG